MMQNNAAGQLLAFIERIERLKEERKTIGDDIADVFKELTAVGFDKDATKTIIKIRESADGMEKFKERSDTLDIYLVALGMLPDEEPGAPAHAHVENIEEFPAREAKSERLDAGASNEGVSPLADESGNRGVGSDADAPNNSEAA